MAPESITAEGQANPWDSFAFASGFTKEHLLSRQHTPAVCLRKVRIPQAPNRHVVVTFQSVSIESLVHTDARPPAPLQRRSLPRNNPRLSRIRLHRTTSHLEPVSVRRELGRQARWFNLLRLLPWCPPFWSSRRTTAGFPANLLPMRNPRAKNRRRNALSVLLQPDPRVRAAQKPQRAPSLAHRRRAAKSRRGRSGRERQRRAWPCFRTEAKHRWSDLELSTLSGPQTRNTTAHLVRLGARVDRNDSIRRRRTGSSNRATSAWWRYLCRQLSADIFRSMAGGRRNSVGAQIFVTTE